MNSLTSKIKNLKSWLIDVRRDLHKTPELGLEEFLTKEKIIKYLEEIGIEMCIRDSYYSSKGCKYMLKP